MFLSLVVNANQAITNNDLSLFKLRDKQYNALSGTSLSNPLAVRVRDSEGRPKFGVIVEFKLINFRKDVTLGSATAVTDYDGIASIEVMLSKKIPDNSELIIQATLPDQPDNTLFFYINVHSQSWIKFLFFELFGGLAIFLFGMDVTKIALQKVAGRKMKSVLSTLTNNRFLGVFVGIFITAVVQSSSATTVLLVGFVSAGLMSFAQSMAVTMGAGIGTTITVQLIAFKLTDYALLLIAIGFLLRVVSKEEKNSQIGSIIMGFGLVFFGIKIMSDTMHPLRDYQPIIDVLASLRSPMKALIVGTFFTALIQSSGATLGIMIALASHGLITLETALPMMFGANIGTTITAVLASIGGDSNAKKTAWWNALYKAFSVLLFYPFIGQFSRMVTSISDLFGPSSLSRHIANSHTIFNVITVFLFIGFLPFFAKLMNWLFPDTGAKQKFKAHYIGKNLLNTPSLALEQAYREILHMSNIVEKMIISIKPALLDCDTSVIAKTIEKDDKVDLLEEKITPFLTAISRKELDESESQRQRGMLFICNILENIGDIISKELMQLITKKIDHDLEFSQEGLLEIIEYYQKTLKNYRILLTALRKEDHETAEFLCNARRSIEREAKNYHLSHIKRLEKCQQESFQTSTIHLDMIECFKEINIRIADISEIICEQI